MKFNKLIPELSVSDFKRSIEFYAKSIGFKVEYTRDKFAFLSFQGSQIMIEEANENWKTGEMSHPFGRGINLQIEVKAVAPVIAALEKSQHNLFRKPKENWYRQGKKMLGCKEFLVQDPDGYLLRFSEDIGTKKV